MSEPSNSLKRDVGLVGAIFMGLGSILGTGVFVSLAIAAGVAGSQVVTAVALAALLAIANGLSSAQLAAAHPVSGGTYEYGYRLIHPLAGFGAGWMFLLAKSASAATAALGFAAYVLHVAGAPGTWVNRVSLALVLVVVLVALVARGVRRSNHVNVVIVSLTLLSLLAFVVVGSGSIDGTNLAAPFDLRGGDEGSSWSGLLYGTALMFVAYTGYGRIATLGEEVHEPARTIPRAIIATLVITMLLYAAVALTAVGSVGAERFAATSTGAAAPLETVARSFGYPAVAVVVAIGAVTAMAGVLLNLILGLSRVLLAMGRRRDLSPWLDAVDPKTGSPTRSVAVIGLVIAGLVCVGDVRLTWSFSAFTVLIYYGLTNFAALRLAPDARRYPRALAWSGLLGCLGLAAFVELRVIAVGVGLLVVGFGLRMAFRRGSSRT